VSNCTAFFFCFFKKGTCSCRLACVVSTVSLAKSSFSKLIKPIWNKKKQSTTKRVSFDKYKVPGVSYYIDNIRSKSVVKAHHCKLWISFVRLQKKLMQLLFFLGRKRINQFCLSLFDPNKQKSYLSGPCSISFCWKCPAILNFFKQNVYLFSLNKLALGSSFAALSILSAVFLMF